MDSKMVTVKEGPGYAELSRFYKDLNKTNTFEDLWNLRRDLGTEMATLRNMGLSDRTTYRALKGMNDELDNAMEKYITSTGKVPPADLELYKKHMGIYSDLKKISLPFLKSTIVNERRAEMSLPEQISLMQAGYLDMITDPVKTAGKMIGRGIARELAERNTRGGSTVNFFKGLDTIAKNRTRPLTEKEMKDFTKKPDAKIKETKNKV